MIHTTHIQSALSSKLTPIYHTPSHLDHLDHHHRRDFNPLWSRIRYVAQQQWSHTSDTANARTQHRLYTIHTDRSIGLSSINLCVGLDHFSLAVTKWITFVFFSLRLLICLSSAGHLSHLMWIRSLSVSSSSSSSSLWYRDELPCLLYYWSSNKITIIIII